MKKLFFIFSLAALFCMQLRASQTNIVSLCTNAVQHRLAAEEAFNENPSSPETLQALNQALTSAQALEASAQSDFKNLPENSSTTEKAQAVMTSANKMVTDIQEWLQQANALKDKGIS